MFKRPWRADVVTRAVVFSALVVAMGLVACRASGSSSVAIADRPLPSPTTATIVIATSTATFSVSSTPSSTVSPTPSASATLSPTATVTPTPTLDDRFAITNTGPIAAPTALSLLGVTWWYSYNVASPGSPGGVGTQVAQIQLGSIGST